MDQLDYNLKRFADAVYADAENEKQATLAELSAKKEEQFSKIEDQLLRECYHTIQSEIAKIRNQSQLVLSEETQKSRRQLLERRQQIEEAIFAAAEEKLLSYTSGEEYRLRLKKELTEAGAPYRTLPCTLFLRRSDLPLSEELCSLFTQCRVEAGNIRLGGFILRCDEKHISIDGTFDSRLAQKREEFKQNSGLTID